MRKQEASWRQPFLGSIQGQLQLATGAMLLFVFSIASLGTLWITRQNLIRDLKADTSSINKSISDEAKNIISLPTLERNRRLLRERERQTNWKHTVWLELADGTHLLPSNSEGSVPPEVIWQLIGRNNPKANNLPQQTEQLDGTTVLSLRQDSIITGLKIGVAQNITAYSRAINQQVFLLAVTWAGALLVSLQFTSLLVKRIVKPLRQLEDAAAKVNSETLPQSQILLQNPPREVAELASAYNALIARLAQAWGQQQQFVSSVSHELRTPLTIISGYLQRTLRRSNNLTTNERKDLTIAADETDRMIRLLGDLLTLSRSDCSHLEVERQRFDPLPLMEDIASRCRRTLIRPITVEDRSLHNHQTRQIFACPDQLKQVLLNLIENADKYSPQNRPIELGFIEHTNGTVISIKDHGVGISSDELPRIFERFYRGSNSHRQEGSGLGLSVVQLLADAMGARIEVNSTLGEGSCFSLHWPPLVDRTAES